MFLEVLFQNEIPRHPPLGNATCSPRCAGRHSLSTLSPPFCKMCRCSQHIWHSAQASCSSQFLSISHLDTRCVRVCALSCTAWAAAARHHAAAAAASTSLCPSLTRFRCSSTLRITKRSSDRTLVPAAPHPPLGHLRACRTMLPLPQCFTTSHFFISRQSNCIARRWKERKGFRVLKEIKGFRVIIAAIVVTDAIIHALCAFC